MQFYLASIDLNSIDCQLIGFIIIVMDFDRSVYFVDYCLDGLDDGLSND